LELAYGCLQLFREIDINGDGTMEWEEFMQYIIDAVSSNPIPNDEDQVRDPLSGGNSRRTSTVMSQPSSARFSKDNALREQ